MAVEEEKLQQPSRALEERSPSRKCQQTAFGRPKKRTSSSSISADLISMTAKRPTMVLQNPSPWPSSFEPLWFSPKSGEEGAIGEEKGGQAVIAEDSSSSSESDDELADLDPLDLFWKVVSTSEEAGGGAALEELRESVPEGALDVTFGQGTGRTTPLHEAIRMMNTAAAKFIISTGCDLEATDGDGLAPLMLAVKFNLVGAAGALLEAGARLDGGCRDEEGRTPFHIAAGRSTTDMLSLLLSFNPSLVNEPIKSPRRKSAATEAEEEKTPLEVACVSGGSECLKLLLENETCSSGGATVDFIVSSPRVKEKESKVDAFASAFARRNGCAALRREMREKSRALALLLEWDSFVGRKEKLGLLRKLLLLGCDPGCWKAWSSTSTCLMKALADGDKEVAELLLAAGADAAASLPSGREGAAARRANSEAVAKILRKGPPANEAEAYSLLLRLRASPQSLRYYCRTAWIRSDADQDVRRDLKESRERLGLPAGLDSYLALEELD